VRATAQDSASGQLELTGHIEPAQPSSLDLSLRMADVTLVRRDEVTAALSGDLFASGNFSDLLVAGQVETKLIEVRLIDALPPEIVQLDITEVGQSPTGPTRAPAERAEPFGARLEIDVNIPDRLFVRGRGLDSEWQGNLRVFGTTQDAEVTGRISAVRGQFSFAGKTFDLARGQIAIDERGGEFAVILDVETTFTDDDFTAKINLTGPTSKPEITLNSTPELPRDEILARILFGRGTGQLSPIEALQLAESAAVLSGAGGASTGALDTLRSALGVDVLQVEGGEGDAGPTVQAGKYVADGVFVGAKQGAGPDTSAATVEVELTPNLSVESEVGQTGRSELGVSWKFNY
jgi:translocation and assembly module TamB